ncbi:MAG: cupin domain-containing protein [Candidatus Lernaella stagnicola]|nr:cupin domain-containing protein [Candidatus Lernaella stagnicola]
MSVKPYTDVPAEPVPGDEVQDVTMRVVIGPREGAPRFVMRVFEVAPGGYTPHHQHDFEHEIFFHTGKGEVQHAEDVIPVAPGHTAYVAPMAMHQIRNTGDEPLVFVCLVPAFVHA